MQATTIRVVYLKHIEIGYRDLRQHRPRRLSTLLYFPRTIKAVENSHKNPIYLAANQLR